MITSNISVNFLLDFLLYIIIQMHIHIKTEIMQYIYFINKFSIFEHNQLYNYFTEFNIFIRHMYQSIKIFISIWFFPLLKHTLSYLHF